MDNLASIRARYHVPARIGQRIRLTTGGTFHGALATITGANASGYLLVWPETTTGQRMKTRLYVHPRDVEYVRKSD